MKFRYDKIRELQRGEVFVFRDKVHRVVEPPRVIPYVGISHVHVEVIIDTFNPSGKSFEPGPNKLRTFADHDCVVLFDK